MTAKEKAKELICKFEILESPCFNGNTVELEQIGYNTAKKIALTAVDEIINSSPLEPNFADWDDCGGEHRYFYDAQKTHAHYYWQEVKQEIQNL